MPTFEVQHLSSLMGRRRQLIEIQTIERNHALSTPLWLQPRLQEHLAWLEQEIEQLN